MNLIQIIQKELKEKNGIESQSELAKILDLKPQNLTKYLSDKIPIGDNLSKKLLYNFHEYMISYEKLTDVNTLEIMDGMIDSVEKLTDTEKSKIFKLRQSNFSSNKSKNNGKEKVIQTAIEGFVKYSNKLKINAIYEMREVWAKKKNGNSYFQGLSDEKMEGKHGIYIFYDSSGNVIYVGKAERTDFKSEVNQQCKRVIKIYGENLTRNLKVQQGTITKRVSLYEVNPIEAIHNVEAILIRAMFNHNTNVKIEKFW